MIIADASGLVALGSVDALAPFVDEFDVRSSSDVMEVLEADGARHGPRGAGARVALSVKDQIALGSPEVEPVVTTRLDRTTGSAVALARELDAEFYLTDERRAIHELRQLVPGDVVTPGIALLALVRMGRLRRQDARFRLEGLLDRARGADAAVGHRVRPLLLADDP